MPLVRRENLFLLAGVLLALFVAGSLFDHDISRALFSPTSAFGIAGAAFGEIPAGLALVAAGVLLLRFRGTARTVGAVARAAGGCLLYLIGAVFVILMPTRYLEWSPALVVVLGAAIVAIATVVSVRLATSADPATALKVAAVLALVVVAEMIIVNVLKVGWDRPRMRMLAEYTTVAFDPWWSPGNPQMEALLASGVEAEEFKSFPSGHVANAATLMLVTLIPLLKSSLRPFASLLFWGATLWAGLIALTRIVMGAHFLTDTIVGWAITLVVVLVTYRLVFRAKAAEATVDGDRSADGLKASHADR